MNRRLAFALLAMGTAQAAVYVARPMTSYRLLGLEPKESKSRALDGLRSEHDKGVKDMDTPELVDLFDAGAAAATEHFEIAAYNSLIEMMDALGQGRRRVCCARISSRSRWRCARSSKCRSDCRGSS